MSRNLRLQDAQHGGERAVGRVRVAVELALVVGAHGQRAELEGDLLGVRAGGELAVADGRRAEEAAAREAVAPRWRPAAACCGPSRCAASL
jgi:hypothetical protein